MSIKIAWFCTCAIVAVCALVYVFSSLKHEDQNFGFSEETIKRGASNMASSTIQTLTFTNSTGTGSLYVDGMIKSLIMSTTDITWTNATGTNLSFSSISGTKISFASSTGTSQSITGSLMNGQRMIGRFGRANTSTIEYIGTADGCSAVIYSVSTTAPTYNATSTAFCNP